jgi:hypothetical protein
MKRTLLTLSVICALGTSVFAQNSSEQTELNSSDVRVTESKTKEIVKQEKNANNLIEAPAKQVGSKKTSGVVLPVDFPKLINTGNATADAADYKARKTQWIADNPLKYEQLKATSSTPASSASRALPLVPNNVSQ